MATVGQSRKWVGDGGGPRWRLWLLRALGPAIVVALLWPVGVPLFIVSPGPVKPAGEMVSVTAPSTVAMGSRGVFLVTTLTAREASVGTAFLALFDPRSRLLLRRQLLPPGQNLDSYLAENEELMRQSQIYATAAALDYLGYQVQITGIDGRDPALELPAGMTIEIDAGDISGPSAGLIFALEIANHFTAVDLTAGATVAGTGTIGPDGIIGAVGGVPFKMAAALAAGAQTFVMPPSDEVDLARAERRLDVLTATELRVLIDILAQRVR